MTEPRLKSEVEELHQLFQDWFTAAVPLSRLERLEQVLSADFELINPNGDLYPRAVLLPRIRAAYGCHADLSPPFRIWVEACFSRRVSANIHVVTYQEWQARPEGTRGRLSTAVLRNRRGTPNGVEWLHVHEVWLPEAQKIGS